MPSSVTAELQTLRQLHLRCGGRQVKPGSVEDDVVEAAMSPAEAARYRAIRPLQQAREHIAEIETVQTVTRRAELSNAIRRLLASARKEAEKLRPQLFPAASGPREDSLEQREENQAHYEKLKEFIASTEMQYKTVMGRFTRVSKEDNGTGGRAALPQLTDGDFSELSEPMVSVPERGEKLLSGKGAPKNCYNASSTRGGENEGLQDQEEFAQYFAQLKKTDQQIDEAVDRIEAGIQRTYATATGVAVELQTQHVLLEETEQKVQRTSSKMKGLNKQLKDAIKKVDQDRCCMYFFCLIVLLGIAGAIYWTIRSNQ